MRVIGGIARGRHLKAPPGMNTRPITDRIKESLFNIIASGIEGATLLDLFAGSGSVGIEALSRRAKWVGFIDNKREAVNTIKANLDNCGFSGNYEIFRNDVFKAVEMLRRRGLHFDYIYVDPPFTKVKIFDLIIDVLDKAELLDEKGIVIIRTPRKKSLPESLDRLERYRLNHYGESSLHYYRLDKEGQGYDGDIQDPGRNGADGKE
ncbi:MAG: 16S rRNA (guanine(966)-N(2))-methyltransferase RsmD [Syntrophomonas sp.]|uniref:16S rRNA (guanine(966)-N(2))-methyltransferase RsmD n=1 Tax=Syntrophomonas sp. TaxID=2053627 RepID=UPI00262316C0|nr:16S rRNA (guanine(966)-N(2))-methyltransferase RsmD [Syntrophomonas sp.]MDD2510128.1 16S rRNA (guanine(966)-N(2))-methyltransferase RsmD [Syntrophomonas sp.]MDD3878531.1 16S rRNA (guanine(966)-N(2))-methyltransferase RsmD [Syntrophomonas sp.]MDD4626442.1 16S rRNA (guanine(966)-N(2))-methyltransferase RsmD [Syntrophomonas sp.]